MARWLQRAPSRMNIRFTFQAMVPDVVDSSQQELPEAHDRFDDAKHRFWNLLAQCIA
jgi:hypothetical protein